MKKSRLLISLILVLFSLLGCQQNEQTEEKQGTPLLGEVTNQAEVTEDDFVYRLVSEKQQYQVSEPIKLYAELEYTGDQDEVEITHATSPFYFPITETTREYDIEYSMDMPLERTMLKKGESLRMDYESSGSFLDRDTEEYKTFMKQVMNGHFPAGQYVVDGNADFNLIGTEEKKYQIEAPVKFQVAGGIKKFSLSKSKGFGQVNGDIYAEIDDEESAELIQTAILNAVKQPGIVDTAASDYDMKVSYEDGGTQGYHLWIGEKGQKSTIMRVDDTHRIYTVSKEMTELLFEIVNK
ncbi:MULTISPECIES: hypothetical protein [Sporosarcina]|uniref:hypothetical protein n=1 Tax=Sporosarcina TaxID=1569 RepID=UPI00129BDA6C|nr:MULTISPECIES: hypothetical protein [Sporosarcina]GKV63937.1 hypothetical protein NCCP2331_00900 [Sporosarcina sp. NCCP-2331]GLB54717.1 hypothetical protein NCCP2378_05020 [Sporosarcina sp. NCCP-2378]